ncbi:52 kDa repressor of the inhibitor of the protein kinase-like [Hydractinia symbiolongicarpus]|uniref:52 kDa repressor of the inhibitor of the protein kinase-like n=1 Tax=Hydractinia symbiolongicarpus TaxID=13093 RepID=UPI00254CD84F|nr:52 kDa repressor of the inhibitor of the protein kinase-like [Hydractinia symbiolongicarpus]
MLYPNIFKILHILAVVPVTTSSCERSISMLRRAKTYLRSSMTQDRLNGLVLLNIHNKMKINLDDVTDMLAIKYPKRLKMLDIQNDV